MLEERFSVKGRFPMVEAIERTLIEAGQSIRSDLVLQLVRIGAPRAEDTLRQVGADSEADLVRRYRASRNEM